ncbi:MAG TPA: hypothetical protein VGN23_00465 [Verrucomicrobiae bacterium]|jgi:hypothetical protein
MKSVRKFFVLMTVAATLFAGRNIALSQIVLTVSPPMTSNTYAGSITLNITGLTNTEKVIVERWLDANANGVIDPNEPLMETFKINDGGAMIIGGITNLNVPYDSNSTTGAITTSLNFAPPMTLVDIVGQQIFKVVSPTGRFSPVTATFQVTNAPLAQSVSGVVYSNGVAPLPNAIVVALSMPNQNYAGATVADSAGNYYLTLPAGQYGLIGLYPGYYVDQNLAPFVTLTNGVNATNNMSATNSAGPVIAGQVYDVGDSNGLGGVSLQLTLSGGSLFAIAFCDTNGNYSALVTSNNWKVKIDSPEMARRAYLVPENNATSANAATGSVSNVNIGLLKANALYYGQFVNSSNMPLPNYDLNANDFSNQFKADGFTDANGNYSVAVLNTTNSPWSLGPGGDNIGIVNYIVNLQQNYISNNITTASNNFFLLPIDAEISGQITDNAGHPVSNIGISAFMNIGSTNYSTAFVDTDTNGDYTFGAANGTWDVSPNENGGHSLSSAGLFDPSANHYVTIPPTNAIVNIVVYPADLPLFGQPAHLSASQFNFNLYGANNNNYTVQFSTNLVISNWTTVTIISNLPNSPYLIQDLQATNRARYYRAFLGP